MVTRHSYEKWIDENGYALVEIRANNEAYVVASMATASKLRDLAEACTEAADYLEKTYVCKGCQRGFAELPKDGWCDECYESPVPYLETQPEKTT